MPRPIPSSRALKALKAQLSSETFTCPSCLSIGPKTRTTRTRSRLASTSTWKRSASTVAPVTSVNASRPVPEGNRELHSALSSLEQNAISYVNFSQLSLALRGLESKDPATRIAIRQSGTSGDSKRLARLLLADPLGQEEDWESRIRATEGDARSLLITYAKTADYDTTNPLLRVLSIPAPVLLKNRLELLLLNPNAADDALQGGIISPEEALVTKVETPISTTGRYSQVTYPVHKAVTIASGLRGIRSVPTLHSEGPESDVNRLIAAAVDVTWENPEQVLAAEGLLVINLEQAEKALAEIRESSSQSTSYERNWLGSKVADINGFILDGTLPSTTLKPAHRAFISNVISSASDAVETDEARAASKIISPDELALSLQPLNNAITAWSESAHTELRDELENAFASRSWRKLAWYKLPFRVDDVTMIGSDIIGRYYLVDAEKGIVWVAGRLEQAGLTSFAENFESDNTTSNLARRDPFESEPDVKPTDWRATREVPLSYFKPNMPWPQQIALSRSQLLAVSLPALQARAQSLVLQALSGSAFATAVGGLAYAMVSTTGLYEAGAVASLGVAISARRLQKLWDQAKANFVRAVRAEGKLVLEETEKGCRDIVQAHYEPKVDDTTEDRNKAREAITRARETLDGIK